MCSKTCRWVFVALSMIGFVEMHAELLADFLLLTVDQLFALGVENSLKLKADGINEQMSTEQLKGARAAKLADLQVGLKGGVLGQPIVFQHGLSDPNYPDSSDWSQNYEVNLTQPVYRGGKIRHSIHKSELTKDAAILQTAADRADVKLELMSKYLDLFCLHKQKIVLERNIEESERRLENIHRMKREGLITNNDVLRSEMQLTNDRLLLTETNNDVILLSQQLDILLGLDDNCLLMPDTALLSQAMAVQSYEECLADANQNALAVKYLRKKTEIARADVQLANAEFLPEVSLYASNALARPIVRTMTDLYYNSWNVGIAVSYPLSSLFKNNHKVRESKLAVSYCKNEEELNLQQVRVNVRTAYLRHHEALEWVDALQLSVRQAEENYRIMQNRYLNQLAILTDLLDANSVRLNAELQLTSARTPVIYTYYQLQHACGRL